MLVSPWPRTDCIARRDGARIAALAPGTDVEHRVTIAGEIATCTCPWYVKHRGERGHCKHVLAVQIVLSDVEECGE